MGRKHTVGKREPWTCPRLKRDREGTMSQDHAKKMTRRSFLAGTAGAAAIGAAALAGCTPKSSSDASADVSSGLTADVIQQKWAFEIPPDPIADDKIANTVESDVVIIGGGTSGLVTAARLLEAGLSVSVIAMSSGPVGRGGSIFVMGSKLMDQQNVSSDIPKAYKKMMGYHSFLIDQEKWWLHANRSREAMDWLIDLMESGNSYGGHDLQAVLEAHYEDPEDITSEYWGTHDFIGGPNAPTSTRENPQQDVVENLSAYCEKLGGDLHYSVIGEQLVRGEGQDGRVEAVIAKEGDGSYTKYVGKEAVVLATGDFGQNEEMVHRYCPEWIWDVKGGVDTGTGHQMGLWVGAAWQKTGMAAPMVFNFQYVKICNQVRAFQGLLLNKEGRRFSNEDNVLSHASLAALGQTDHESFAVWDTAYAANGPWGDDYYGGPSVAGENGEAMIAAWDAMFEVSGQAIDMNGASLSVDIFKADTIEDVAQAAGLPVEEVVASVERYNGFCSSKADEDFHKREGLLLPVSTPPYYLCRCTPWFLVATGGLQTNLEMQVLDTSGAVIPGLYAVGTIVGDMYANCYSTHFPGHNLGGNCLTFGYVAAEAIAQA